MQYLHAKCVISLHLTIVNTMKLTSHIYAVIAVILFSTASAFAQSKTGDYWKSFLPYGTGKGVATDGNIVYAITDESFFTYKPGGTEAPEGYSKVEGMNDMGMQCIAYDITTSTAVLVYENSNIDLFKDNTFYNIPDLKIKTFTGAKEVYQVYAENGTAYLSTSTGVLAIDLTKRIISNTFQFIRNNETLPVKSFTGAGDYFYAVTQNTLYKASKSSPDLQNFQSWQMIDTVDTFTSIANVNNKVFLSTKNKIYTLVNDSATPVFTSPYTIQHISAGNNRLLIGVESKATGGIWIMNMANAITDTFECYTPTFQAVELLDNTIWYSSKYDGLKRWFTGNESGRYIPAGPTNASAFDIYAHNKELYIAHGGHTDIFYATKSHAGVSYFNDNKWTAYKEYAYTPFDTLLDFVALTRDEINGTLYMGSYMNGLFILKKDATYELVGNNSIFDGSIAYGPNAHQVIGVTLDNDRNLWATTIYGNHQLYVKTAAGNWHKFSVPIATSGGAVVVDDDGQVWFISNPGGGVVVYNTANTLSDPTDDSWYHLTSGPGFGNLPSNNVLSIAKDKNNEIWIGTDNGIAIAGNCTPPFQQSPPCDAQVPIVQYDKYAGYLFEGNTVNTIAVDGANRKWVGTNDGVWLLSEDAQKIVYRFTVDNSPLPSNRIRKISVDKITGDVYFGTELGVVSFHSTATEGGTTNQSVTILPNPVPTGFAGTIAIKGLVENADVRITDMSGQLVYKTKALGGQAIWNGYDYTGRRPQSGVYIVFVANSTGTETYSGKLVFMK